MKGLLSCHNGENEIFNDGSDAKLSIKYSVQTCVDFILPSQSRLSGRLIQEIHSPFLPPTTQLNQRNDAKKLASKISASTL
jgi:hypothetical protein